MVDIVQTRKLFQRSTYNLIAWRDFVIISGWIPKSPNNDDPSVFVVKRDNITDTVARIDYFWSSSPRWPAKLSIIKDRFLFVGMSDLTGSFIDVYDLTIDPNNVLVKIGRFDFADFGSSFDITTYKSYLILASHRDKFKLCVYKFDLDPNFGVTFDKIGESIVPLDYCHAIKTNDEIIVICDGKKIIAYDLMSVIRNPNLSKVIAVWTHPTLPNDVGVRFASTFSCNAKRIAIAAPYESRTYRSEGVVYVFDCELASKNFGELEEEIESPMGATDAFFGSRVQFIKDNLVITDVGHFATNPNYARSMIIVELNKNMKLVDVKRTTIPFTADIYQYNCSVPFEDSIAMIIYEPYPTRYSTLVQMK